MVCCKSDVSVVIFAYCAAVVHAGGSNTPSYVDSKARSAVKFGACSAAVHALCVYLYRITL